MIVFLCSGQKIFKRDIKRSNIKFKARFSSLIRFLIASYTNVTGNPAQYDLYCLTWFLPKTYSLFRMVNSLNIIFKLMVSAWVVNVHPASPAYIWRFLKKRLFTNTTYNRSSGLDISMTFSFCGNMAQKNLTNLLLISTIMNTDLISQEMGPL